MCEAIAIANQKGGVGKTTTVVNLAVSLVQQGKRVLVVDADPQANTTSQLTEGAIDPHNTIAAMMQKARFDAPIGGQEGIMQGKFGVDIVPSNILLAGLEIPEKNKDPIGSGVMRAYIDKVKAGYDFVLFDTNPSLGRITVNALSAADSVIIPLEPAKFSTDGLNQLAQTIASIRSTSNPRLTIRGILFTRHRPQVKATKFVESELRKNYGSVARIYDCVIPDRAAAVNSQLEDKSVFEYDKGNDICKAYNALAAEIITSTEIKKEGKMNEHGKSSNRTAEPGKSV